MNEALAEDGMGKGMHSGTPRSENQRAGVVLAATQGLDVDELLASIKAAGFEAWTERSAVAASDKPVLDVDTKPGVFDRAAQVIAENPKAVGLLVYPAPTRFIASALEQGSDPAEALNEWLRLTEPLLTAYRQARRRNLLVERDAALANPAGLVSELNRYLGCSLKVPDETHKADPEVKRDFDPVFLLVADQTCHQNMRARRVAAELEASSLPLQSSTESQAVNVSAALRSYLTQRQQALQQSSTLREENELLFAQLHQVQDELESLFLKNRESGQKIERLEREKAQQNHDQKEENELLILQLQQLQENLGSYSIDNERLRKEVDEIRHANEGLQNTVDALYSSMSWKITAPIRRILRPFMGK